MPSLEEMNQRLQALELSHENLRKLVTKRLEHFDRQDQIGCVILQGKKLPPYKKNEKLSDLVVTLAKNQLNVNIDPSGICFVRRIAIRKTAPILMK